MIERRRHAFRIGAFRRGGAGAVALIGPRDLRFRSTRGGAHMLKDSRGVAVTATNQAAVDAFDRVVEAYLRFGRDTGVLLKRVAEEDPDMPMAHVLLGYFFHLMGTAALLPRARRCLEAAEAASARLTPRERMHRSEEHTSALQT